jgi:Arc/MetJ-type ribon-helix-helix transcriptional regulator
LAQHDVQCSIEAAVNSGRFASVDDAMTEAASMLLDHLKQEQQTENVSSVPATQPTSAQPRHKPIWEIADELRGNVPSEEWAKLPVDGAAQHDHYIYGTPKRPAS